MEPYFSPLGIHSYLIPSWRYQCMSQVWLSVSTKSGSVNQWGGLLAVTNLHNVRKMFDIWRNWVPRMTQPVYPSVGYRIESILFYECCQMDTRYYYYFYTWMLNDLALFRVSLSILLTICATLSWLLNQFLIRFHWWKHSNPFGCCQDLEWQL